MINTAVLVGRVGKIETNIAKNGNQMTNISLVTTKNYVNSKGKSEEQTTWHNVNCYSKISDYVAKRVNVGDLLYVIGEIQNKLVTQDGNDCYVYSLHADKVKIIQKSHKLPTIKNGDQDNLDKSILCAIDHGIF